MDFLLGNSRVGFRVLWKSWRNGMGGFFVLASSLLLLVALPASCAQSQSGTSAQLAPLRVAIAGLVHGHAAGFMRESLHRPDIQIVGIAEPDERVAARYQREYGFGRSLIFANLEEMLEKTQPQAVLAYTNTLDHRRVVETCARHGVHVMMEKPLAVNIEDGRAIARAAKQGKIYVLVNYETTWYRSNAAAYALAHTNAIGEIRKVVVHDGHRGPKEIGVQPEFLAWLTDPKLDGGGALYDFGCYGADLMTWLMVGQRPTAVTAITQQIKPDVYPRVDDEATIVLTYPRAQAILQASWNWPFDRKDMEVYGQTGYVITVRRDEIRVRRAGNDEAQMAANPLPSPLDDSLSYFAAVISGRVKSDGPSSLETNLVVTEILDAARRSAISGQTIQLAASDE